MRHPLAYEIALTIVATKLNVNDMEEAAYETLNRIGDAEGWSDDRRADIYSRIAERIPKGAMIPMASLISQVSLALWENESLQDG